ncbi:MAG TPA: hypothetical protein VFG30_43260 [Polyangiales bacterium]|nr:hypothetical protein [Polyangiales bacterium]
MISGQRSSRPRGIGFCGVLIALWGNLTAPAHAQTTTYRLVLVQPDNAELIPRVEGQTRDLGVTLQVAPSGWSSGSAEQAARVATERGADFVARVQRSSQGVLEVRVYAARQRSLRARKVPSHARSDRLTTSAELEAAALVLRGELSALIEAEREAATTAAPGGTPSTGVGGSGGSGAPPTAAGTTGGGVSDGSRSQQLPSSAGATKPAAPKLSEPEPAPTQAEDEDEEVDEADEPEEREEPSQPLENYSARTTTWTLRGGARVSTPLESKVAVAALVGGRAQLLPFLEVGLALSTALPIELGDQNVRIAIWRSSFTAEALAVFPVGPRLRALIGIDLGAVLYARSTDVVAKGYSAAGSTGAWSATLGAQGELQWLLTRQFGVALGVGLAYLPQKTRFAYTGESPQPDEIAALRSLEPHATASLFGLFGD